MGTQDPREASDVGGEPLPLSCVRGTLVSGAAIKRAMCQVACLLATTELICNSLYKLYLQIEHNDNFSLEYKKSCMVWGTICFSILKSRLQS